MDRLSDEEVKHVATLARLDLTDEERDVYAVKLKEILDEVDKIKDVVVSNDVDVMISPNENVCVLRDDKEEEMLGIDDILKNAPHKMANYVEVKGVYE